MVKYLAHGKALKLFFVFNLFYILEPPVIVPFSFGSDIVNTGVYSQLLCVVSQGDMPVTITWSLKGQELSSGPELTTTMLGTRTSMLTISSVYRNLLCSFSIPHIYIFLFFYFNHLV